MPSSDKEEGLVAQTLYQRAHSDLDTLRTELPEAAVVSLAREVLMRLSEKSAEPTLPPGTIDGLARALVGSDAKEAADLIEDHYRDGMTAEDIYLRLLAPATKRIGEWWNNDTVTFAKVTVGVGRVYGIMRSMVKHMTPPSIPEGKAALFASVPGENHNLGVKMAADLCRERGWHIDLLLNPDHDRLLDRIADSNHMLVGLSAGGIFTLPSLTRIILALRVSHPSVKVVIAGQIVDKAPRSLQLLHVDGMSNDFNESFDMLEDIWASIGQGSA